MLHIQDLPHAFNEVHTWPHTLPYAILQTACFPASITHFLQACSNVHSDAYKTLSNIFLTTCPQKFPSIRLWFI
jgi:hypothetical protein